MRDAFSGREHGPGERADMPGVLSALARFPKLLSFLDGVGRVAWDPVELMGLVDRNGDVRTDEAGRPQMAAGLPSVIHFPLLETIPRTRGAAGRARAARDRRGARHR